MLERFTRFYAGDRKKRPEATQKREGKVKKFE